MLTQTIETLSYSAKMLAAQESNFAAAHNQLRACLQNKGRVLILSDQTLRFKAMHFYEELVVRYKAAKQGPDRARVPALWLNDILCPQFDRDWIKDHDLVVAFVSESNSEFSSELNKINPKQLLLVSEDEHVGLAASIKIEAASNVTRSAIFSLVLHILCEAFESDCPAQPVNYAVQDLVKALEVMQGTSHIKDIECALAAFSASLKAGGSIYLFGNGGSACDALELCHALRTTKTTHATLVPAFHFLDPSLITCAYNDGYSPFARAVEAQVGQNDLVIAYSTSGNSKNILEAVKLAHKQGAHSLAMTALTGELANVASNSLRAPASATARIQEIHALLGQIIVQSVSL